MITLLQGDCIEKMKELADNSIDSIVTDPPYELGFMGKSWDNTGIANNPVMWKEALRVLKPGGHLLAFSGTRTYHRMASAIEDAGFEVRDMIEWVYGSGFPKSLNIGKVTDKFLKTGNASWNGTGDSSNGALGYSKLQHKQDYRPEDYSNRHQNKDEITEDKAKQWEGWGTALKPAHEPICMARKPLVEKTVAENVLKYGTGGINIDESRVDYQSEADKASATPQGKCTSNTSAGSAPDVDMSEVDYNNERYWYKNEYKWLIDKWLNDEDYVWSELKENLETYDWCKVPEIDSGDRVLFDSSEGVCIRLYESKRKEFERPEQLGRFPANLIHDNSEEVRECFPNESERFFKSIIYQAKASKSERNKGCEEIEQKQMDSNAKFHKCSKCEKWRMMAHKELCSCSEPEWYFPMNEYRNNHPTVKPIALMEYLIKMVTKEGGTVLDPFMGSGSTGVACKQNGYNFIGIELEADYIKIAEARIGVVTSTDSVV